MKTIDGVTSGDERVIAALKTNRVTSSTSTGDDDADFDCFRFAVIADLVEDAPRDVHGVFYNPQLLCQQIADVLGKHAPDRAP